PVSKMHNLQGGFLCRVFYSEHPETGPQGYICFDCDEPPVLKDAAQFEKRGDTIALIDNFVVFFEDKAWCLYHPADVETMRLIEKNEYAWGRWLLSAQK